MSDVRTLQRNLGKLGLYLGEVDGNPGALTCDALARFLAGPNAPPAGPALAMCIPADWWGRPARVNMLLANVQAECAFAPRQENLRYTTTQRLVEEFPHYFGPGKGSDPAAFIDNPIGLANLVYGGREGNCTPTDGWTFRGRGWPQLSFRSNYRTYSLDAGMDLERNPDAMLRLDVSARVTIAFMRRTLGLLNAADAGDVAQVRHLWNGGANGLDAVQEAYDKLTLLWSTQ